MKKLILFMSIFAFTVPAAFAEPPQRKVIKPPTTARPQRPQERRVITPPPTTVRKVIKPPTTVRPQLPQGFGRPIQRPPGFGKQEWQKPQVQQPRVQPRSSRIYVRPYVHPFYYPSVETRFDIRHGFYRTYHPPVINPYYGPPVIVQPQPVPIYPAPYGIFFFQFRF